MTTPPSTLPERAAFAEDEPGVYVYAVVGTDVWRFDDEDSARTFMRSWDLHGTHELSVVEWVPPALPAPARRAA